MPPVFLNAVGMQSSWHDVHTWLSLTLSKTARGMLSLARGGGEGRTKDCTSLQPSGNGRLMLAAGVPGRWQGAHPLTLSRFRKHLAQQNAGKFQKNSNVRGRLLQES